MSIEIREEVDLAVNAILEECEAAAEFDPPFECRAAISRIRRQALALASSMQRVDSAAVIPEPQPETLTIPG